MAKSLLSDSDSDDDDDEGGKNVLEGFNDKMAHTTESLAEALERRRKDQVINDTHRASERMRKKYNLDKHKRGDGDDEADDYRAEKKGGSGVKKGGSGSPPSKKKSEGEISEAEMLREERRRDNLERNRKEAERIRKKYNSHG
jgi:hypothetical protein